jgi:signal transduction histidine kinase
MGIAAEDIDKIFNQFYRSQSNSHPEIKGTGLGLSIVKDCVLCSILKLLQSRKQGTTIILRLFSTP